MSWKRGESWGRRRAANPERYCGAIPRRYSEATTLLNLLPLLFRFCYSESGPRLPRALNPMTETLLLVVIALLTVNILFVGVYIVLVLKEVRQAVSKMNQILDSFSTISTAIANPVSSASGFFSAVVEGVKAFHKIQDVVGSHKGEEIDGTE